MRGLRTTLLMLAVVVAVAPLAVADEPSKPDPDCPTCRGLGLVPLANRRPYVHVEGDKRPSPASCVPWRYCPKCQRDRPHKELVDAEDARLDKGDNYHLRWEERIAVSLVRVETRHVTLHCQLPKQAARAFGLECEELAKFLQKETGSVFLTPTRPDNFNIVMVWNDTIYDRIIRFGHEWDEFKDQSDETWKSHADSGGFQGHGVAVANLNENPRVGEALFWLSYKMLARATEYRADAWLRVAFSYHCEQALLRQNEHTWSSVYRDGEGPDAKAWDTEARKLAIAGRIRPWEDMFRIPLRDWDAREHLCSYAMVQYLMREDPERFVAMCREIRNRRGSKEAIERAYGKKLVELEPGYRRSIGAR